MEVEHDNEWLDEQVCPDKGYGIVMRDMAMAYHKHMTRWRPLNEYDKTEQERVLIKAEGRVWLGEYEEIYNSDWDTNHNSPSWFISEHSHRNIKYESAEGWQPLPIT